MKRVRTTASGLAASGWTAAMRLAAVGTVSMLAASTASAQQLDKPIEERVKANEAGAASQKRVEEIATATDGLIGEYRLTMKKIESLDIFNNQLRSVVDSQNEELASLQRQIDGVDHEMGRRIAPQRDHAARMFAARHGACSPIANRRREAGSWHGWIGAHATIHAAVRCAGGHEALARPVAIQEIAAEIELRIGSALDDLRHKQMSNHLWSHVPLLYS